MSSILSLFRRRGVVAAVLAVTVLLPFGLSARPAAAVGIVVNSAADDVDAFDGECTLREAIIAANTDTPPVGPAGECAAGSGTDAITFAANYTITLDGSQLPAVISQMTISGNGATNTIIQANAAPNVATFRIFSVSGAGDLTLDGVTVRHGRCAGACAFDPSAGGGIFNLGTLAVKNSTLSGNSITGAGGGIYNFGTLTVTNSTLSGNSAATGGGIYNLGTLTVTNSTLSGNSVPGGGGGILNDATLTVTNSTLSGNSALNGGGIYNFGLTATLVRSLVSGNSANEGDEVYDPGGTVSANAHNVFGHSGQANADAFSGFAPSGTDVTATSDGTNATALAAILNTTLADNGGPTQTHALVADSPAIDLGPSAGCTTDPVNNVDQRGEPRNVDGKGAPSANECDAGAYEYAPPATSYCPVGHPAVAAWRTDLLGTGMGGPTSGARNRKVTIPNWAEVYHIHAQLAAVDIGQMKWVRFSVKDYPTVQVKPPTSPAVAPATVKWWGSGELPASPYVKGAFFWGAKGNRSPRALVVWPTYVTGDTIYANVLETFDSPGNYAHHSTSSQTLSIPATQAAGAKITVHVALVDVNKDQRPVILTVAAGGVEKSRVITVPNRKESLNIETFVFEAIDAVPAETDEVTITLESPPVGGAYPFGGDSAAMIGAAANYACAVPD